MPLAATLSTEKIFEAFLGEPHEFRAFYYGRTYTGNPLGPGRGQFSSVDEERMIECIQPLIHRLSSGLARRSERHSHVADIRQWGLMAGVELVEDRSRRRPYPYLRPVGARATRAARKAGVLTRPLGQVIVLTPPLSVTEAEIGLLLDAALQGVNVPRSKLFKRSFPTPASGAGKSRPKGVDDAKDFR
jgi:adenosylmethionine-8-amino-7-oxononanoate aminotransferase